MPPAGVRHLAAQGIPENSSTLQFQVGLKSGSDPNFSQFLPRVEDLDLRLVGELLNLIESDGVNGRDGAENEICHGDLSNGVTWGIQMGQG